MPHTTKNVDFKCIFYNIQWWRQCLMIFNISWKARFI
jgi:hypothetical protein